MQHYYNTNHEEGTELLESESKAQTQEELILEYFQFNPGLQLTPFGVKSKLDWLFHHVPITSIRRAMTNLTKAGYLMKTNFKETGKYGKKNYLWSLNKENMEQCDLWNDMSKLP